MADPIPRCRGSDNEAMYMCMCVCVCVCVGHDDCDCSLLSGERVRDGFFWA